GIREPSRGFAVVAEGRHPEHASARRHDAAGRASRAGVVDLDVAGRDRLRLLEPDDGEALLIALGISAGCADDADGGARIPLEGEAGETTWREASLEEREDVGLHAQEDGLRLGISEAHVELENARA